nr:hypothetical protein [uncultured Selenomonas sp.]
MNEDNYTLILPNICATLPCPPSEEIICIGGGRAPEDHWLTLHKTTEGGEHFSKYVP